MNLNQINTIDEVISTLENIINDSKKNNSTLGYFAALYQKVTLKVKEGIENNIFDDGLRMEKLDVIFAKRYIDAYYAYQNNEEITESWKVAFGISTNYWPIVLQHLLIGMNAHINLDLGIAAAEVSKGKNINDLEGDFNKINDVLSSLVNEAENDLAEIWPTLKIILKNVRKVDDFLVDFSMKIARDGAWKFAKSLANNQPDINVLITERDLKVAKKATIITNPGFIANAILRIIRLGKKGNVSGKITALQN